MSDYSLQNQTNISDEIQFSVPPDCKVRFYNDDYTTQDFVVEVLLSIFHKSEQDAVALMQKVHTTGSAVVGVYTYDIAITRANLATKAARDAGFPLKIIVEE